MDITLMTGFKAVELSAETGKHVYTIRYHMDGPEALRPMMTYTVNMQPVKEFPRTPTTRLLMQAHVDHQADIFRLCLLNYRYYQGGGGNYPLPSILEINSLTNKVKDNLEEYST